MGNQTIKEHECNNYMFQICLQHERCKLGVQTSYERCKLGVQTSYEKEQFPMDLTIDTETLVL